MRTTESGSLSKIATPLPRLPLPFRTFGDDVELTTGDLLADDSVVVDESLKSRTGVFVARTSQKSGEPRGTLSNDDADDGVTLTPAGPRTPIEW